MSRIDTATLQLNLKSGFFGSGSGETSAKVKVFALSYNVLRVMSGRYPCLKELSCKSALIASRSIWPAKLLLVRGPPYSFDYQGVYANIHWPRENSGKVIMSKIGQSAWLDSQVLSPTETERELVGATSTCLRYSPSSTRNRWRCYDGRSRLFNMMSEKVTCN